jgi:type IV secretory pathway VirJ component
VLIVAAIVFAHVRVGALVAAAAAADAPTPSQPAPRASGAGDGGAPVSARRASAAPQKHHAAKPARARHPDAPRKAAPAKASAKTKPPAHDPQAARILDVAALGDVTVYAPKVPARGLALFASGDGGWNLGVWDMAHTATELGYWVAGFSTPAFLKALENGDGACSDGAALLDTIGAKVRHEMSLPESWRPTLIGYSSGATVVYAALAQAGDARFSGAMTLGFCPDLVVHKPFCEGAGLTAQKQDKPPYGVVFDAVDEVPAPWIVLQGEIDQVCNPPATQAFVAGVHNASVVMLPKVGHGYSVPRNWLPQYRQGLIELIDADARDAARNRAANP